MTSDDHVSDTEALVDEVYERVLAALPTSLMLVTIEQVAEARGVTKRTVRNWLDKYGLDRLDATGRPKEPGDGGITYIHWPELIAQEKQGTASRRRDLRRHRRTNATCSESSSSTSS